MAVVQQNLSGNEAILIQNKQYSIRVVQLLHQSASRDNKEYTQQKTMDLIIENQLIADEAIRQFGEEAFLHAEDRVGFSARYMLENQYVTTVQYLFRNAMQSQAPSIDVKKFITKSFACEPDLLKKALFLGQHQEFKLPDAELKAADNYKLLSFQFPSKTLESISLGDIYREQNVQGRIALHNGDCGFLQSTTDHGFMQHYVIYWVETHSGLSVAEIQQIKMALRARYIKDQYLAKLGIAEDAHDDSDYVIARAKKITSNEIYQYYDVHKDQFKRVTKAKGRHLLINTQELADKIYAELLAGLDFNEAIKKYSQADDKNSASPGAVDWVYNNASVPWRDTLFLILPPNKINPPLKAPFATEWEIIMVDKRVEEYQAKDSEGVRYQVAQILARQKIKEEFSDLQKRLYANTLIRINPLLINK